MILSGDNAKTKENIETIVRQILMTVFAIFMLLPFFFMITSSLKVDREIFTVPIKWLPEEPKWENYANALKAAPFALYYFNSIKIIVFRVGGAILFSSLTAFAFAKLKFRGRDKIFMIYLATMMIPPQIVQIPNYILMSKIGWINTHLALIIPGMFMAYSTFMLRQFYVTIPDSLLEAARMDGAGYLRTFLQIMFPLTKPAYASMAIILSVWSWNNLMEPLIYLNSADKFPVILGMGVFKEEMLTEWSLLFAASVVALLPLMAIYILGQKFFVKGLATSGIKG